MVSSLFVAGPKSPDLSIPPRRARRRGRWRRERDKPPRCPYCLEFLGSFEEESLLSRACLICRHQVPILLQTTPLHLFDKLLRWVLIYHELDYIWNYEWAHLKGFQHTTEGFGEQYSKAKAQFEELNEARHIIQNDPGAFLDAPQEPDVKIILELRPHRRGGRLGRDLSKGRRWRQAARELSAKNADYREVTEFQWDMVRAAPWGAYGYCGMEEKKNVLRLLETRMSLRETG